MTQRKFIIKDGVLLETKEVRIEDRTKLFKYNPNLKMLAEDIKHNGVRNHCAIKILAIAQTIFIIGKITP